MPPRQQLWSNHMYRHPWLYCPEHIRYGHQVQLMMSRPIQLVVHVRWCRIDARLAMGSVSDMDGWPIDPLSLFSYLHKSFHGCRRCILNEKMSWG